MEILSPIEILPNEMLHMISDYLNIQELYQLSIVNKLWNDVSKEKLDKERNDYEKRINEVKDISDKLYQYMVQHKNRKIELTYNSDVCEDTNNFTEESRYCVTKVKDILNKLNISIPCLNEAIELQYHISFQIKLSYSMIGSFEVYTVDGCIVLDEVKYEFNIDDFKLLLYKLVYHNIPLISSLSGFSYEFSSQKYIFV